MFLLVLNEVVLNAHARFRKAFAMIWFVKLINPTAITTIIGLVAGAILDGLGTTLLLHDLKVGFS